MLSSFSFYKGHVIISHILLTTQICISISYLTKHTLITQSDSFIIKVQVSLKKSYLTKHI